MTDQEMAAYLRENGYPEHVVRAGRAGLIDRWGKFVAEVERGYRYGLEDYRNDLDLRGIIAMLGLDAEVAEPGPPLRSAAQPSRKTHLGKLGRRSLLGLRISLKCRASAPGRHCE